MQQRWRHSSVSVVVASTLFLFRLPLLSVRPLHVSSSLSKTVPRLRTGDSYVVAGERKKKKEREKEKGEKNGGRGERERAIDRAIRSRKITKPPALRRVPNMKYAVVKRIHRILQITTPMWSVAKRFRARRFFVAEKLNKSKILYEKLNSATY